MDQRLRAALLALLAVAALGAAAANIDDGGLADVDPRPGGDTISSPNETPGRGGGGPQNLTAGPGNPCGLVHDRTVQLLAGFGVLVGGVLVYRETRHPVAPAVVAAPPVLVAAVACGPLSGVVPVGLPPVWLLGGVVALLLGGAAVVGLASGDDLSPVESEDDGPADPEAIGRAAGRAADRIEGDAAVDNEVYRAWREMTDLLDVDHPESCTPGEFADAAVDAGLDRADVTALTDLFREVRYGGATPDEDRERRAVEALRHVEAAYAGGTA